MFFSHVEVRKIRYLIYFLIHKVGSEEDMSILFQYTKMVVISLIHKGSSEEDALFNSFLIHKGYFHVDFVFIIYYLNLYDLFLNEIFHLYTEVAGERDIY